MKQLTRISLHSGLAADQSALFSQTNAARGGFGPLCVSEGQATTAQRFSACYYPDVCPGRISACGNPVRDVLFIGLEPRLSCRLFVFQRRGGATGNQPNKALARRATAPLKNKKVGVCPCLRTINRPSLTGFVFSDSTLHQRFRNCFVSDANDTPFSVGSPGGRRRLPKGRLNRADWAVPPGIDSQRTAHPTVKRWAIVRCPSRTEPAANLLNGPGSPPSPVAIAIALCAPWLALDSLAQTPPTIPLSLV
jgi:hypothetical protein